MTKTKRVEIEYIRDNDFEMNDIKINGLSIAGGNDWDNNPEDQIDALESAFGLLKIPYKLIRKKGKYTEGGWA